MNDSALIHDLLTGARTIAVVGYSTDPTRPSNSVSRYLRGQGFRIVPVNPKLRGASLISFDTSSPAATRDQNGSSSTCEFACRRSAMRGTNRRSR